GSAVRSALSPEVERRYQEEGLDVWIHDFVWAPSADAVFFSGRSHGVWNVWKVGLDRKTLQWVSGPERLTTGAGDDRFVAITADGHKLAFNAESDITRLWSLPFDPLLGKIRGEGDPVTSTSATPWGADLTADGKKLAVVLTRRGEHPARVEVTERSLADEGERLLISDGRSRDTPRWSPDG